MRKIRRGLCAALLCLLLAGTAGADGVRLDAASGVMTVEFDGAAVGESYSFLAVRGTTGSYSLTTENVLFADQVKADAGGVVSVAFIGRIAESSVFLLGGRFSSGASPRVIGSYAPASGQTARLPAELSEIGSGAFAGCDFSYVYLGDSVLSIGSTAFAGCAHLVYIEIPPSVETIGDDAFKDCPLLAIGCVEGSAAYRYAVAQGIRVEPLD